MRGPAAAVALCLLAAPALAGPAAGAPAEVDVALVLVSDVSRSIDDSEFRLQKQGYAAAFASPELMAAIKGGHAGAIAVAYVEFATAGEVRTVLDWTTVRDEASAAAFVGRLAAAPRSFVGRTAIGDGIAEGIRVLRAAPYRAARQVIDVCGDGTNNSGRDVAGARDEAVAAGITVNGLTIINDHPVSWTYAHVQPPGGLTKYYRDNVIGGPGSFALEVHDFAAFGAAMTRKLIDEIAALRRGGSGRSG